MAHIKIRETTTHTKVRETTITVGGTKTVNVKKIWGYLVTGFYLLMEWITH